MCVRCVLIYLHAYACYTACTRSQGCMIICNKNNNKKAVASVPCTTSKGDFFVFVRVLERCYISATTRRCKNAVVVHTHTHIRLLLCNTVCSTFIFYCVPHARGFCFLRFRRRRKKVPITETIFDDIILYIVTVTHASSSKRVLLFYVVVHADYF